MKVKQLIKILKQLDPELEVWISANDGDDIDYSSECEVCEEGYVNEEGETWGIEDDDGEDDDDKKMKVVLIY